MTGPGYERQATITGAGIDARIMETVALANLRVVQIEEGAHDGFFELNVLESLFSGHRQRRCPGTGTCPRDGGDG